MTKKWPPAPSSESRGEFIFVVVDVIGSSRLFDNKLTDPELRKHHEALNRVHKHVLKSFRLEQKSNYEWNWAGDGGVLAFPANILGTTDDVLACAQKIANLKSGECRFCVGPLELQVRTILHRGEAYYHPNKGFCRSGALNFAAKARVPGKRMSLTITNEVYENLDDPQKENKFRPLVLADENATRVFGYLPWMVDAFDKEIGNTSDHAQAAHLAYRLGVLHFSEGNRDRAVAAFTQAIDFLGMIGPKHRYFHRTLHEFYESWRTLSIDATDSLLQDPRRRDHLSLLRSPKFARESGEAFRLLLGMELIIEQLDVLASNPVNDPTGLTSLEICLLLERVGYPREWYGPAVYNRLRRIESEMNANKTDHTVDEGCCLCSGVAASCLILNYQDADASRLLQWLRAQKRNDYCGRRVDRFTRAPRKNHGLNYAAMVLQAFVDHNLLDEESHIRNILNLSKRGRAKRGHFPDRWTKNVTSPMYDFSTYAFHALARYSLAGGSFDTTEKNVIKNALRTLAQWLRQDAIAAGVNKKEMGRPYAARENIGSLALGLLIDENPVVDEAIVGYNLRRLAINAADPDIPLTVRARTMDSNLDRIRKMLEGWLLQMESALYRREKGWSIPAYVTEWLGISAKQP